MSKPTVFEQLQWAIQDQARAELLEAEKTYQKSLEIAELQHEYAVQSIRISRLDILQQAQAFCGLLALMREAGR